MGQSKQTRMASIRLLLFVTASASGQFVFFGNQHGPPRALGASSSQQPAPAPAREARVLVQPQPVRQQPPAQPQPIQPTIQRFQQRPAINSGVTANSDSRFAPTFFRPLTKLHHPGKNALPESDEPAKFVKILSDPDLILTEEGGVRRTTEAPHMMEMKKREREGRLVVEDAMVSLPQFVTPAPTIVTTRVTTTTTPAPTTTSPPETTVVVKTMAPFSELERTAAPVTRPSMTFFDVTTQPPMTTTTARAVVTTAKPMMRIVSSVRSSPFTLGSPRVTQLNQSPRMSQFPTVSISPAPSPAAAAAPRAPKALPATPSRAQVK